MAAPAPQIVDVTYANNNIDAPAPAPAPAPVPVPEPAPAKLYIATPCYGCLMSNAFLLSILQLQAECGQRGIECFIDFIGNESLVQRARNVLAARFLANPAATHLLFIDADIGFRSETVFRLLEADKGIATAVYPKKSYSWETVAAKLESRDPECKEPVHMMGLDFNINLEGTTARVEDGFIKVLDSATGFMMIRRDVMEKVAARFADTLSCVNDLPGNRDDPGYIKEYVAVFDCMIDPKSRRYLSEDYAFVRRAQEVGVEIWADVTSPLCHVGNYQFEGDLRQRFSLVYAS